jgi:hypothetical protein
LTLKQKLREHATMDGVRQPFSAEIYQFPIERWTNRRAAVEQANTPRMATTQSAAAVEFGGWYHGAAVEEAARRGAEKPGRRTPV